MFYWLRRRAAGAASAGRLSVAVAGSGTFCASGNISSASCRNAWKISFVVVMIAYVCVQVRYSLYAANDRL